MHSQQSLYKYIRTHTPTPFPPTYRHPHPAPHTPHPPHTLPTQNVLAKLVIDRVPSVEMVRFVSSGTEACLSVLRLMRAFTKREKIIKFVGCYHGHADSFLVKAGSGVATLGLPDSPGECVLGVGVVVGGWVDGCVYCGGVMVHMDGQC